MLCLVGRIPLALKFVSFCRAKAPLGPIYINKPLPCYHNNAPFDPLLNHPEFPDALYQVANFDHLADALGSVRVSQARDSRGCNIESL